MKYDLMYLTEYNFDKLEYFKSKKFFEIPLDVLLKHYSELEGVKSLLEFHKTDVNKHKEKIDNPLKILDFLKEIKYPEHIPIFFGGISTSAKNRINEFYSSLDKDKP
jgi:hypothetical protein